MPGFDHTAPEGIERVLADFRRNLYTSFPARITRYYPDRGTVDVEPGVMREVPGEDHEELSFEDLGELTNLPVQWPRAAGFVITFPLRVGDWVKVHCAVQSLLVWRQQGQVHSHPGIDDPLGLNGCWVEPGCYPDNQRVRNVNTTDLVIGREDGSAVIRMTPTGAVNVKSSAVTVGPGFLPPQAVTKDDALHMYLDVLFGAMSGVLGALTPLPAAPVPATSLWETAKNAAEALKSQTASLALETE